MNPADRQSRLKAFALRVVVVCEALPAKKLSKVVEHQLLRSAFSAAANYRSSCNAISKKAFTAKLSIALEEADESVFWLETIKDTALLPVDKLEKIIDAGIELTKILGASRRTARTTIKN